MKNPHYEYLGRRMREYHRTHQWRLSEGGLYVPHAYWDMGPESLSSWDDCVFRTNVTGDFGIVTEDSGPS